MTQIHWLDPERDSTGVRIKRQGTLLGVFQTPEGQTLLVVGRDDQSIVTIPTTDARWHKESNHV